VYRPSARDSLYDFFLPSKILGEATRPSHQRLATALVTPVISIGEQRRYKKLESPINFIQKGEDKKLDVFSSKFLIFSQNF
jgi:hypothetical protein